MCTKFHRSLIKNIKIIKVWNFFYKSAFRWVRLDGKIMCLYRWNFSGQYWIVRQTCIPNLRKFGHFLQIDRISAGRLIGLVCIIRFPKKLSCQSKWLQYKGTQKIKLISQGIQKLSHLLVFFWKISIRRFFGRLGQYNWYGSIKCHRETKPTKFHRSMKINNEVIGWAGSHHPISKKFLAEKQMDIILMQTKNQIHISRRSKVITFLVFFWKSL